MKKFVIISGNIGSGKSSLTFHLQVFFLSKRFKHHQNIVNDPCSVVQDRSIYEDVDIFAKNLYEQGIMEARDYYNYSELFKIMVDFLSPPSLIVYLQASIPTLKRRIALRGRDYEKKISEEYLGQLNRLYEKWIADFSLCPILKVPTDELDFVQKSEHLQLISDKICAKLQGVEKITFK